MTDLQPIFEMVDQLALAGALYGYSGKSKPAWEALFKQIGFRHAYWEDGRKSTCQLTNLQVFLNDGRHARGISRFDVWTISTNAGEVKEAIVEKLNGLMDGAGE